MNPSTTRAAMIFLMSISVPTRMNTVPGMVYAAVKASPVFGGKAVAYERESIRSLLKK
jgi:hypothetical protein